MSDNNISRDELELVIAQCFADGTFLCHPDDLEKPVMQRRIVRVTRDDGDKSS